VTRDRGPDGDRTPTPDTDTDADPAGRRARTDGGPSSATSGSGPGPGSGSSPASSSSSTARSILRSDALKIVALMAGIYLLFTGFGVALGYGSNGIVNTLQRVTFLSAVYAMAVLALNLHWGYTGLFNIGVAGFMAVGAYVMTMLTAAPSAPVPGLGLPFWVGAIAGMLAAAIAGGVAALPALRLRADYLAIVTIAFAEVIRFVFRLQALQTFTVFGVDLGTGGARGISGADPDTVITDLLFSLPVVGTEVVIPIPGTGTGILVPSVLGSISSALQGMGVVPNVVRGWVYAMVLVAVVAGFYWLLVRIGNSPFGRVLKAIREDEDVARALGKDTGRFKIKGFMLGCGLLGLVGILWQGSRGFLNPTENFLPQVTFFVWIALIIGGPGSNTGSVLGGALFAALLFEGPRFVVNVVTNTFDLGSAPPTISAAVADLLGGDLAAMAAYVMSNIDALRFVLVGVILVYLMQNRPDGLLGHRKEIAASVDLSRPTRARSSPPTADGEVAADGAGARREPDHGAGGDSE
jgi:branched-chain amino acid transport system permease protein